MILTKIFNNLKTKSLLLPAATFATRRKYFGSRLRLRVQSLNILSAVSVNVYISKSFGPASTLSFAVKRTFNMESEGLKETDSGDQHAESKHGDVTSDSGHVQKIFKRNNVTSSLTENLAKPGCQAKHKFDDVMKEPSAIVEQAEKRQRLEEEEQKEHTSRGSVAEETEDLKYADTSVSLDNVADCSVSFQDETVDSVISDISDVTDPDDGFNVMETIVEDSAEMDEKAQKAKARALRVKEAEEKKKERMEKMESKIKDWWETLSKVPDMFKRLEACQGSDDFKEVVDYIKSKPKKGYKGKGKADKVRPNYFISLQITDEKITNAVKEIQECILAKDEELKSAMISPATLHLTLMVMHLTEEQLPKARQALDEVKLKVNSSSWVDDQIRIHGVGTFRGEVVFGKVESNDGHKQLEFMKNVVTDCFSTAGFLSTDKRKTFNPHLTIMKLSKARKKSKVKKVPESYYEEFLDRDLGVQPLGELQLCAMMKQKDENGYYHVEHKIDVKRPEGQTDAPVYFEELSKTLNWVAHEPEIDALPFFGREFVFSNHHEAEFVINGLNFTTSEQWYMLCKAMFHEQYDLALRVLETSNPKAQKRLCSHLPPDHKGRSWDATAKRVMTIGVAAKFSQNQHLAGELLRTGNKVLVEASPTDCRWGIGLAKTDPRVYNRDLWRGENWLGQIIMAVREGILKETLPITEDATWIVTWDGKGLPEIEKPQYLSDVFSWNENDLPELAPKS